MSKPNAFRDDFAAPTPMQDTANAGGSPGASALPAHLGVYQIQARLGQGGMGTVYRAWHTRLKRLVALKTLRADFMDNVSAVARFQREMEAIGKLDHPNLIHATDAGEDRGIHFLVMEFVEGLDADKLSRKHVPFPIADACEVVRQAATGLQYVHEHDLVHRDIKPSNLMVTPAGLVKVLDLGLARLHGTASEVGELTDSHQWMGTADYMAPEQGLDAHGVDIRADVYSLGCTLYKLLAGQAPFGGSAYNTPYKKMDAHAHRPTPPLCERRPDVPAELVVVVERMMAKSPDDRFTTPGEVAEALADFAVGSDLSRLVSGEGTPAAEAVFLDTGSFGPLTLVPAVPAVEGTEAAPTLRSAPPRRRWWVAAGLLVAVTMAALVLLKWPSHKLETVLLAGRELTPGVWHNVLDRPPEEMVWPRDGLPLSFDPKKQQLLADCEHLGLLRLGVTPATGYKIQLGIKQNQWVGDIGLFLGAHEERDGDDTILRYQQFLLYRKPATPDIFSVTRTNASMRHWPGGPLARADSGLVQNLIAPPGIHECILEVEVGRHGMLAAVRWGGQELPELVAAFANAAFTPRDYAGGFGIVLSRSTGVFSNARLMILEKEGP